MTDEESSSVADATDCTLLEASSDASLTTRASRVVLSALSLNERAVLSNSLEALDSELRLSLVARGLGVGLVTPIALKRSAFRGKLKPVRTSGFNPAVRAWIVHRAPAGRLARPIKLFRDGLDRELQALIGG